MERIVEHRVKGRFTEYKVMWKGLSSAHNSWVAESDLNCPKLVAQYNKELQSRGDDEDSSREEEEYEVKFRYRRMIQISYQYFKFLLLLYSNNSMPLCSVFYHY